jgi:menaquinol-cytochrome c reductase cytochrome b/c subunit
VSKPIELIESDDPIANPWRVALLRSDIRPSVRESDEKYVMTFPHLIVREVIVFQLVVVALSLMALFVDAPLEGIANPLETPNPAKAPWYFLGLQELLHYFPPVVAGVVLPTLVIVALVVIPYGRVNLHPEPLWARESRAKTAIIAAAFILLTALFGIFQCWPIVVPTAIFGIAVFVARLSRDAGGWRGWLWTVTLPAWIMTWFVTIAAILTLIGTFFRGPGWSWVWPWEDAPRG